MSLKPTGLVYEFTLTFIRAITPLSALSQSIMVYGCQGRLNSDDFNPGNRVSSHQPMGLGGGGAEKNIADMKSRLLKLC